MIGKDQPGDQAAPGPGREGPTNQPAPAALAAEVQAASRAPTRASRWVSSPALRYAVLPCDAIAALCGFYAAFMVVLGGGIPPDLVAPARYAAPLLIFFRLGTLVLARVHRLSRRGPELSDLPRHAIAMVTASVLFALVCPGFPLAVYGLELLFTGALMLVARLSLRLVEDQFVVPAAQPDFEGPRRALNILVAIVGLIVTLPLWIAIAVAIKLTSPGPVFYLQERVGLDTRRSAGGATSDPRRRHDAGGRLFRIIKFRTMAVDAERATGAVWSGRGDPRVTRLGRFLRHYRLDELPQFINVLRGDMNVVGPRPERPTIFADLRARIPHYQVRQRVRPGITGRAQVHLEYDSCLEDVTHKVSHDLEYIARQGTWYDVRIMARTMLVMLFRDAVLRRTRTPATATPGAHGSTALGGGELGSGRS